MKKLIIFAMLLPMFASAQRQTEYNRKGDDAMKRQDYRDAKMWYEEGVSYCDLYSINQLTLIWQRDETMRVSMRTVMNKCLNCLNDYAMERDTASMKKLIYYYSKGIGTTENEATADYWRNQLQTIRHPYGSNSSSNVASMRFFAGYQGSLLAPIGIQVGGIGDMLGWYVRFRSNLSFQGHDAECRIENDKKMVIEGMSQYYGPTGNTKATVMMGSAGVMVKTIPDLYVSAGVGYWQRNLLREYEVVNDEGIMQSTAWAKDLDSSENGIEVDLDATYILGDGHFYITAGCSAFNFKYLYPNAGVGVIF